MKRLILKKMLVKNDEGVWEAGFPKGAQGVDHLEDVVPQEAEKAGAEVVWVGFQVRIPKVMIWEIKSLKPLWILKNEHMYFFDAHIAGCNLRDMLNLVEILYLS